MDSEYDNNDMHDDHDMGGDDHDMGGNSSEDEAAAAYAAITSQLAQWGGGEGDGEDDHPSSSSSPGRGGMLPPTTPFGAKTPAAARGGGRYGAAANTPHPDGSPTDHPFAGGGGFTPAAASGGGGGETPGAAFKARLADPLGRRTPVVSTARGTGATPMNAATPATPGAAFMARLADPLGSLGIGHATPAGGGGGGVSGGRTPGGYYSVGGTRVNTPFPEDTPGRHPFYGDDDDAADDFGDGDDDDDGMEDDDEADDEGGGVDDDAGYTPRTVRWGGTSSGSASVGTPASTRAAPGSAVRLTPGFGLKTSSGGGAAFGTPGGVGVATPAGATPGTTNASRYGGAPMRTPGSPAVNAVRRAVAAGGGATPGTVTAAATPAGGDGGAGAIVEEDDRYDPSPLYDPRDNADRPYLPYLSRLLSYLDAKSRFEERSQLIAEEEELGQEREGEKADLERRMIEAELELLGGFAEACRDRSAAELDGIEENSPADEGYAEAEGRREREREKFAAEECDLWSLLSSLRTLGPDALLYSNPPPPNESEAEVNKYQRAVASSIEFDPADVVRAVLNGFSEEEGGTEPPLVLLRRSALLRWIEGCHARRLHDGGGINPPAATTMWGETAAALAKRGTQEGKVASFHLDAPLLTAAAGGTAGGGSGGPAAELFGNDDARDAELLRSALAMMRAGDLEGAKEVARGAGQAWRAAAWSGGEPYGRVETEGGDDVDDAAAMVTTAGGEEKKSDDAPSTVGNPARALWQCTTRKLGRTLSASSPASTTSTSVESAIAALLADDLPTSLASVHHRTYLSSLHLLLKAAVGRSVDETLHLHASNRRGVGKRYPYPGSRYEEREREHLSLTSAAAAANGGGDEGAAFERLEESEYGEVREEARGPLRRLLSGFASGAAGARGLLVEAAADVLAVDADEARRRRRDAAGEDDEDDDVDNAEADAKRVEADALRRTLTHALLYLDLSAPAFSNSVVVYDSASSPAPLSRDDEVVVHDAAEVPARDAILYSYVRHLTDPKRRSTWHVATPYAALLRPMGLLVSTQASFVAGIHDSTFRGEVSEQMGNHMTAGTELLVLRRAVRMVLDAPDEGEGALAGDDDGFPLLSLLGPAPKSKAFRAGRGKKARGTSRPEDAATIEDVRRMHAVRWLSASPRGAHRPDGVVAANALLRSFLLLPENTTTTAATEKGVAENGNNRGLDLARVFLSRFVPHDAARSALEYYSSEEYELALQEQAEDDIENGDEISGGAGAGTSNPHVLALDECEDAASELGALRAYVAARDACEAWRRVARRTSPVSPLGGPARGSGGGNEDNVEDRIASKMERRSYLRLKAESGRVVAEAASAARECLAEVLEYGGGWLAVDDSDSLSSSPEADRAAEDSSEKDIAVLYGGDPNLAAYERSADIQRRRRRSDEASELRSRVLPLCAFLLRSVLDGTGRWMEEFEDDAAGKFGKEEGGTLLRGLLLDSGDGAEMGDDGEEAKKHRETPLTPDYWHRAAVGAASKAAVGDEDADAFGDEDRKRLLEAAAESAVRLLVRVKG